MKRSSFLAPPYPRASGLLLHITSLPSPFGIGDLGSQAYRFIDFLSHSKQTLWQILPLGPTGYGNSPYMAYSAMAVNPLLISLEKLQEEGLLKEEDLAKLPKFSIHKVNYEQVIENKFPLLRQAWTNFQLNKPRQHALVEFCQEQESWLEDYALFMALKKAHQNLPWYCWETDIARRQPQALKQCQKHLQDEIAFNKFLQFLFWQQWSELRGYAARRGVQIIGDIPFYIAHDSADVWAEPENFQLNPKTGELTFIAGAPPDFFSSTGQIWGNPLYNWNYLQSNNFRWWIQRFNNLLAYVDLIRIDHFRGFEAYWQVPQGETTAINGEWIKAPGDSLFNILLKELGYLPVIAEDIGTTTLEVDQLRNKFNFPGLKVLQFAFDSSSDNVNLPFNYTQNCVVYTGNHDNDTIVGWFEKLCENQQKAVINYLGDFSSQGIHWGFNRMAMSSVANQAIIPVQDLLGLGSEARMNIPGQSSGNWVWRCDLNALTDSLGDYLKTLAQTYGRI
ncbi:4-alpha-glucanotransferase [Nostoc sp. CHAB 5824]|nr:4-alpha-glucanotransferase [Nostoc sp. CHAB 5824]